MKQYRFDGSRAETLRKMRAETEAHLSIATGRSVGSVRNYERGTVDPPASIVCKLAAHLGVHPGELFAEVEP